MGTLDGLPGTGDHGSPPLRDDLFRVAMIHSAIGMALVAPNGDFLTVNPALCAMLGRTEQELTASTWQELTHPDDLAGDEELVRQVLDGTRDMYRLGKRYLRPDGVIVEGDLSVACVREANGSVAYLVAQIVDVTEATAARERYRLLAENATDVVALGDSAGILRWVSPSASDLTGWQPEDYVDRPFRDFVHPDDRHQVAMLQERLSLGESGGVEIRMSLADGSYEWMDVRVKPVFDPTGIITGRVASWRRAVGKVERDRFRAALDAELDAHVFLDAVRDDSGAITDLVFVDANALACDYLGLAMKELQGSSLLLQFPGQRATGLFAQYADTIDTGQPLVLDAIRIPSEIVGEDRHFSFRGVKAGEGLSLTWRDVTDSTLAAAALADSEARFQLLAENASDVVFEGDVNAVVEWVSPSVRDVLGRRPDEIVGRPATTLVAEEDIPIVIAASQQANAGGRVSYRARYRKADGTLRWAEVTARPVFDDVGAVVARVGSLRDVDEQVRAELALAEAEERYRLVAEHATDVVCRILPDQSIDWAFGSTETIIGCASDDLIGKRWPELFPEDERSEIDDRFAALARGEVRSGLARVLRTDGGTRWIDRRSRAVFGPDGTVLYFLSAWRDAEAEVEYRDALAESERQALELVDRYEAARNDALEANLAKTAFLSRMSHELRTPLNAVLGFAQLLAMDPLTDDQRDAVQHIRTGGKHLLDLVTEILDISRIEAGRLTLSMEAVAVSNAVDEAADLVRTLARQADVTITVDIDATAPLVVWADRQRVIQVLLNLLTNAVKYNHPGGSVTITSEALPGRLVAVRVADTGVGISPQNMSRLFTPFDRLGAESSLIEGTGIGLTLCEALARAMSGHVEVSSELGAGSVFSLLLPSAEQAPDDAPVPTVPAIPVPGGRVRVLYIEDNPANQSLMARIVGLRPDATMTTAADGRTGLRQALADPPDLILLDLHLPVLAGDEVLRLLRADPATSGIPVVVVTADASIDVRRRLELLGSNGFITKPVEVTEVLSWIDDPRQVRA